MYLKTKAAAGAATLAIAALAGGIGAGAAAAAPVLPPIHSCSAGTARLVDGLINANPTLAARVVMFIYLRSPVSAANLLHDVVLCDRPAALKLNAAGRQTFAYQWLGLVSDAGRTWADVAVALGVGGGGFAT